MAFSIVKSSFLKRQIQINRANVGCLQRVYRFLMSSLVKKCNSHNCCCVHYSIVCFFVDKACCCCCCCCCVHYSININCLCFCLFKCKILLILLWLLSAAVAFSIVKSSFLKRQNSNQFKLLLFFLNNLGKAFSTVVCFFVDKACCCCCCVHYSININCLCFCLFKCKILLILLWLLSAAVAFSIVKSSFLKRQNSNQFKLLLFFFK